MSEEVEGGSENIFNSLVIFYVTFKSLLEDDISAAAIGLNYPYLCEPSTGDVSAVGIKRLRCQIKYENNMKIICKPLETLLQCYLYPMHCTGSQTNSYYKEYQIFKQNEPISGFSGYLEGTGRHNFWPKFCICFMNKNFLSYASKRLVKQFVTNKQCLDCRKRSFAFTYDGIVRDLFFKKAVFKVEFNSKVRISS